MAGQGIEIVFNDRESIRLHRLSANKSRKTVAEALGRSIRWLGRIERGGSATLTRIDLHRLAAALGVVPTDLVAH